MLPNISRILYFESSAGTVDLSYSCFSCNWRICSALRADFPVKPSKSPGRSDCNATICC